MWQGFQCDMLGSQVIYVETERRSKVALTVGVGYRYWFIILCVMGRNSHVNIIDV